MVNVKEIEKSYRTYFDGPGFVTSKGSLKINPTTGKITVLNNVFLWRSPPDGKLPVEFEAANFSMQIQNRNLTSLEGCPLTVRQNFYCSGNKLTTLLGGPKKVGGTYEASNNPLENLDGLATEIGNTLYLPYHPQLPLLRALVAPQIVFANLSLDHKPPVAIMKKYEGQGKRALFDCQKELEDAGYEGNARW
jgi:hypothetical protein